MLQLKITFLSIFFFFEKDNFEVQITVKVDVVQRNGTDYLIINQVYLTSHAPDFKIYNERQDMPAVISGMVAGVLNSSWRIIRPLVNPVMSRYLGVEFRKILIEPIYTKFALNELFNEFFNMNSTPKIPLTSQTGYHG